jgi:hypothetical protein
LQIDEQTDNDDLKIIEDEINKIEDNNYYFNNQLKLINTREQLLESLVLIESQVNDIKLKALHSSIKPEYLLNQLSQISQHLNYNNTSSFNKFSNFTSISNKQKNCLYFENSTNRKGKTYTLSFVFNSNKRL